VTAANEGWRVVICGECGGENDGEATRCASCDAPLAPTPPAAPAVVADLTEPTRRVAPGQEAVFTLTVRNPGSSPDRLAIEVMGDTATWTSVEPPSLDLLPGSSATAVIRLRPPLGPDGPAGSVDFAVAIRSAAQPGSAVIELGVLEIESTGAKAGATPAGAGATPATGQPLLEPAGERSVASSGRRIPAWPVAVVGVALVAVAAVAIVAGSAAIAPGASPAAIVTPSPAVATPSLVATPSPAAPPSPSTAPTGEPVPSSPDPGGPVAWWQDAYDAAADRGIALGVAVAEGTTDENLPYAEFSNGSIVQRVYDAYWLSDDIWQTWKALGGGPARPEILGYPASGLLGPDLAERRQLFDGGAVYWSPATGARTVHGPVWAWWRALVSERGGDVVRPGESGLVEPLGHPTSDVRTDANGAWVELEAGLIGVFDDGERWVCAYTDPASGFPSCADLRTDPRFPSSAALAATPAP
jgi:hypothetical protein